MSRTKEEILYDTHKDIQGQGLKDYKVNKAMDEYAKQEASEFADWIVSEYWLWHDTDVWINRLNGEEKSTTKLYDLFIKSKEK